MDRVDNGYDIVYHIMRERERCQIIAMWLAYKTGWVVWLHNKINKNEGEQIWDFR